jgi:hypothetical protein
MEGQVPSPTPTLGTLGDSTSVMRMPRSLGLKRAARMLATSHPADPPPTITIFLMSLVINARSQPLVSKCKTLLFSQKQKTAQEAVLSKK